MIYSLSSSFPSYKSSCWHQNEVGKLISSMFHASKISFSFSPFNFATPSSLSLAKIINKCD